MKVPAVSVDQVDSAFKADREASASPDRTARVDSHPALAEAEVLAVEVPVDPEALADPVEGSADRVDAVALADLVDRVGAEVLAVLAALVQAMGSGGPGAGKACSAIARRVDSRAYAAR